MHRALRSPVSSFSIVRTFHLSLLRFLIFSSPLSSVIPLAHSRKLTKLVEEEMELEPLPLVFWISSIENW